MHECCATRSMNLHPSTPSVLYDMAHDIVPLQSPSCDHLRRHSLCHSRQAHRLEEAAACFPLDGGDLSLGDAQQDSLPIQLLGIRLCSTREQPCHTNAQVTAKHCRHPYSYHTTAPRSAAIARSQAGLQQDGLSKQLCVYVWTGGEYKSGEASRGGFTVKGPSGVHFMLSCCICFSRDSAHTHVPFPLHSIFTFPGTIVSQLSSNWMR